MLKAILIHTIFCRYPIKCFSKQHITHENEFFFFFSFMMHGSDRSLISDGPSFLWSSCSQAGCSIWHRKKKSWNFIGYCPRKLYWKILHCKLCRISTNALTHVNYNSLHLEIQPNPIHPTFTSYHLNFALCCVNLQFPFFHDNCFFLPNLQQGALLRQWTRLPQTGS